MIKISTFKYDLIYVYTIHDGKHEGMMKIGKTSYVSNGYKGIADNSDILIKAARGRINQQTLTAGVEYELLYTTVANFEKNGSTYGFLDTDVHEVLINSGYTKAKFPNIEGDPGEWIMVEDLAIVKKAIEAVKNGQSSLDPSDFKKIPLKEGSQIAFREEQEDAITRTLTHFHVGKRMLWNAKMRFGKTLCTLEVVRRLTEEKGIRRTLIITHRPSVRGGWFEDFEKIDFAADYYYGSKSKMEQDTHSQRCKSFRVLEENAKKGKMRYIYFASIQDLRGSKTVGGTFDKNREIFDNAWDLLIVDEAHEGTQTVDGKNVIRELQKRKNLLTLYLSGTPYNILDQFRENEIFHWTYEMEQRAKAEWPEKHPGTANPYEDLPQMVLMTYNVADVLEYRLRDNENDYFDFAEFFRVNKGEVKDGVEKGHFIHEQDVSRFLDLLCSQDKDTNYPFSSPEYREALAHTLWVLPGVDAAKALSSMIKQHDILREYFTLNIAGEGDENKSNKKYVEVVKKGIKEHSKTITLTCNAGRMTTGVTVPEWSGVFMLSGSYNTKAASYLQTIFRAQTPTPKGVFPKKRCCYAFDFAPDRTVEVIHDAIAKQHHKPGKRNNGATQEHTQSFLNFLAVISYDGSKETCYDAITFLRQVGQCYKDHIIRKGFQDKRLFINLGNLTEEQYRRINDLETLMKAGEDKGGSSNSETGVTLSNSNLRGENAQGTPPNTQSTSKPKSGKNAKKQESPADHAYKILAEIYKRLPLLIFGGDFKEENITLEKLAKEVDDESWRVFMPKGIDKKSLLSIKDIVNEKAFIAAASEIRRMTKDAEKLNVQERTKAIAHIISLFRFPDRETVLTPWRVVNMHISDTLGGYDFFNETHEIEIDQPRYVSYKGITDHVFADGAKIMEINSKSGLYPLYMAYSLFREQMKREPDGTDEQTIWNKVVSRNLFVLCMSKMAVKITRRVLMGFRKGKVNARIYDDKLDLVNEIKNNPQQVVAKLKDGKTFWGANNNKNMDFDAIVGNPPYHVMDGGNSASAIPIYNQFVNLAKECDASNITMIMPARWYAGGRNLDEFRDSMLHDRHIMSIVDFPNGKDCFPSTYIAGGVCYFHRNKEYEGTCKVVNVVNKKQLYSDRFLDEYPVFIRMAKAVNVIKKTESFQEGNLASIVSQQRPFGLRTYERGHKTSNEGDLILHSSNGISYIAEDKVTSLQECVNKYKVILSRADSGHPQEEFASGKPANVICKGEVIGKREVCTETWLSIGCFESEQEAINLNNYLKTKIVRFLLLQGLSSIMITSTMFSFVPLQDFTSTSDIDWSKSIAEIDKQLYTKYGLTDEEIAFIEKTIKPL